MKRTLLALFLVITQSARAAKPGINVSIEPSQITLGDTAQLTISVLGASSSELSPPDVDGLQFTPVGQSSQFQSINGAVTVSSTRTYLVTPQRAGTFSIPSIEGRGGSAAVNSKPVTLQVSANGMGVSPRAGNRQSPALPPPNISHSPSDDAVAANGQIAFLRLVTPKREFYVGELVPVEIKAYFRGGMQATLNGLPALSCDAFTMNKLDGKPAQSQETVDGQPYVVLTWTTALSAVKAGEFALSLEMPVLIRMQERSSRPRSFFDDSFFDDFFGRVVEKPVTLRSESDAIKILELPTENRPADFAGAVGRFDIAAEASPAQVTAGDPITLRMKITGEGNFDRVATSLLANSADWKTYKPAARFEPSDSAGFHGAKTLEQAVVPTQSGHRELPALTFSYFDPGTQQYVTRSTTPIAVEVAGAASVPVASVPVLAEPAVSAKTDLAPDKVETGHFVSTLQPVLLQRWFLISNAVAWIGLAAPFPSFWRRQKLARRPRQARASQADHAIRVLIVLGLVTTAATARAAEYSAPGLFNQGNACYRAGKLGEAILQYERARVLAPRDADIAANLATVRHEAKLAEPSNSVLNVFSLNELSWLGSAALLLTGVGLILMRHTRKECLGPRVLSVAAATIMAAAIFALFVRWPETRRAIVVKKDVPVFVAPASVAAPLFTLPEGDAVGMRGSHGAFVLVETGNGRRGWVNREQINPVILTERAS